MGGGAWCFPYLEGSICIELYNIFQIKVLNNSACNAVFKVECILCIFLVSRVFLKGWLRKTHLRGFSSSCIYFVSLKLFTLWDSLLLWAMYQSMFWIVHHLNISCHDSNPWIPLKTWITLISKDWFLTASLAFVYASAFFLILQLYRKEGSK